MRIPVLSLIVLAALGAAPPQNGRPESATAPGPRAAHADSAAGCPPVTRTRVEAGRKLFSLSGNCFACHGAKATGTALGPSLTDRKWLDTDGSYAGIVKVILAGVAKPKAHGSPMPPRGAAPLTDAQVCEVAAYVYSLSHH